MLSLKILFAELAEQYNAHLAGEQRFQLPLRIHYKDYSAWHNQLLTSETASKQQQYWQHKLANVQPVDLLTDRIRPAKPSYKGAVAEFELDVQLSQRLHELNQTAGTSMFMQLIAIVRLFLHRYASQNDVSIGTPITGRKHAELDNQLGFYLNTIVLRDQLETNANYTSLLEQTRQTTVDAFEHATYPLDQLVQELSSNTPQGYSPLFNIMVVVNHDDAEDLQLSKLKLSEFSTTPRTSKFDITYTFTVSPDRIRASMEYRTDLFDATTIELMQEALLTLADHATSTPNAPLLDLPMAQPIARQRNGQQAATILAPQAGQHSTGRLAHRPHPPRKAKLRRRSCRI